MRKYVHLAGAAVLTMHLVSAVLSYAKASVLWGSPASPRAFDFFKNFADQHPWLFFFRDYFANTETVLIVHFVPIALTSILFVWLYAALHLRTDTDDGNIPDVLSKWAVAFGCAAIFAYPLFTQDFWLSSVWGRMSAGGVNPYYVTFSPAWIAELPLDHFPLTMSYGPFWAALSTLTETAAQESMLVSFIIFKALLAAAWFAALRLLISMTAGMPTIERSLAMLLFGWLPLNVQETLAEGHNDIMMTSFALLWIFLLARKSSMAPVALMTSALCKYITAPLFLVDFVTCLRRDGLSLWRYILRLLPSCLFGLVVFALYYRSPAFFHALFLINDWPFLLPRDAIMAIDRIAGGYLKPLAGISIAIFPAIALHSLYRLYVDADGTNRHKAGLAVLCAISLSAVNHLWPWYLIWVIPFAALVPRWWLSRFVVGLALFAPFTAVVWWVPALAAFKDLAALGLYSGAIGWTFVSSWIMRRSTHEVSITAGP